MSARPREDLRVKDACIPDFVVDPRSHKKYKKGRFLGKVSTKVGKFGSIHSIYRSHGSTSFYWKATFIQKL